MSLQKYFDNHYNSLRKIEGANKTFLIIVFVPLVLFIFSLILTFYFSVMRYESIKPYLATSVLLIPFIFLLIYLSVRFYAVFSKVDSSETFKIWVQSIIQPLVMGAFIGVIISLFYITLLILLKRPEEVEHFSVIATIFGIYVTCCGLFVAFWGIFHDQMPIVDLDTLMSKLTKDMKSCKEDLLWSYPGLTFGALSGNSAIYQDLSEKLDELIKAKKIKTHLITLSIVELFKLYLSYLNIKDKNGKQKFSKSQIARVLDDLITKNSAISHEIANKPEAFKPDQIFVNSTYKYQVIIIDDIVYLLQTFGIPIKTQMGYYICELEEKNHRTNLEIIAMRLENSSVAHFLRQLILNEAQSEGNEDPSGYHFEYGSNHLMATKVAKNPKYNFKDFFSSVCCGFCQLSLQNYYELPESCQWETFLKDKFHYDRNQNSLI